MGHYDHDSGYYNDGIDEVLNRESDIGTRVAYARHQRAVQDRARRKERGVRDANQWTEQVRKIEEDTRPLTEQEFFHSDRERDYALANCNHVDSGIEARTEGREYIEYTVCYSCGKERKGRVTS